MIIRLLSVVGLVIMLTACSKAEDADDHVFNEQTRALEKARQVEGTLQEAEERRRQQID